MRNILAFICGMFIWVLPVVPFACSSEPVKTEMETRKSREEEIIKYMYEITYNGCQYVVYDYHHDNNWSEFSMTHKGNCTNPIHYDKKED